MDGFGKRIKKLREDLGWSQEELVKKLDKSSKQTISNWENDRSEPTITDYRKLAELFDTTVSYLLGETGMMEEPRSDMMYVSKSEFIELQRIALNKEKEEKQELQKKIQILANDPSAGKQ